MALWKFYRFYTTSTGGYSIPPTLSWEWRNARWNLRVPADEPLDLSDADGSIFVQYDTSSTDMAITDRPGGSTVLNIASNVDINISAAALNQSTTAAMGQRFEGGSSGLGFFHSENAISSAVIGSFALTNAPPHVKIRTDFNASGSSGHITAFVSFKVKQT
jgi:hypothetical protein